ncbi:MAG: ArsR family transcriptional regulator [Candidatus Heimdallarchaeota archaeon]|nr:MAG: ArsR family transcriptional regulator [Candidatus Heimdallarchaeota archaeon]
MDDNLHQDAITYSQPLLKEVTDDEIIQLFKEKNLSHVIEFLRTHKGPMTVTDLEEAFKNVGEEKSDKSIYRYLKKLEEAGLVIQAGKRVFPSEKKIKTQTLYIRSAKVFYIVKPEEEEACPEELKMIEAIGISIGKHMNLKLSSLDCLEKFLKRFKTQYSSYPRDIIKNAEEEITELLEDLDFEYSKSLIETISLLALLNDKIEWQKDLIKCFE